MSTYIYDPGWQAERERLQALEELHDEATIYRLDVLGVSDGWRCLEVGCGAGSVARWLAARVGSAGHVVATDLDPRFLTDAEPANLEVRRHNIVTDPLEEGVYDLVHARAVLEHIPLRAQALARMVAATRSGGWVVVEDIHFAGDMTPVMLRYVMPSEHAALCERIISAFETLFVAAGVDIEFGAHLPELLRERGLTNVGGELRGRVVWGGAGRDFGRLSLEHLQNRMIGAGLVTEEEVARFLDLTRQPGFCYLPLPLVTAWGQRPVS